MGQSKFPEVLRNRKNIDQELEGQSPKVKITQKFIGRKRLEIGAQVYLINLSKKKTSSVDWQWLKIKIVALVLVYNCATSLEGRSGLQGGGTATGPGQNLAWG